MGKISSIKKHSDTLLVIGTLVGAFTILNQKLISVERDLISLNKEVAEISKEVSVIKAVMYTKGQLPKELVLNYEATP